MAKKNRKEDRQALKKTRPAGVLSPFGDIERFFENYLGRGWPSPFLREWPSWGEMATPFESKLPRVDVLDRDNEIVIRAEVPGVERKDLDVSVTRNSVTIKGSSSHEEKEEKGDYYHSEIARGSFARVVPLPVEVDTEKASSKFKDGILELTFPKQQKSKRRTIKVD